MSLPVFCNAGIELLGDIELGREVFAGMVLKLFINNVTPTPASDADDFTECALDGYDARTLDPNDWNPDVDDGVATYTYPQQTWLFDPYVGGPVTIYGYFVTTTAGDLIFAELQDDPYTVPNAGGALNIDLSWVAKYCGGT